jgi:hypothetical protein
MRADLKFALRGVRNNPGFAVVAVIVLALGIGANTAMFSVLDAVLLRALPFRDPDRMVMLWERNPIMGDFLADASAGRADFRRQSDRPMDPGDRCRGSVWCGCSGQRDSGATRGQGGTARSPAR